MRIPTEDIGYELFFAHSHDDQSDLYSITTWIHQIWEDVRLFLTSRDQYEIYRLIPNYYFEAIRASRCVLFLATPTSLKSPCTLEEVVYAVNHRVTVLIIYDRRTSLGEIQSAMAENLGGSDFLSRAIDICTKERQHQLVKAMARAIKRSIPRKIPPLPVSSGRLVTDMPANWTCTNSEEQRLPEMRSIEKGVASREDTLTWLGMLEKWGDNQARAAGIRTYLMPKDYDQNEEDLIRERLLDVLLSVRDTEVLPTLLRTLRPLVDLEFLLLVRQIAPLFKRDGEESNRIEALQRAIVRMGTENTDGSCTPAECTAIYNQGVRLARSGRYHEALKAFDKVICIDPNRPDAHHNRGAALIELGRYEEAVQALDSALSLRFGDPSTHRNKALALVRLGRHEEALRETEISIKLELGIPNE